MTGGREESRKQKGKKEEREERRKGKEIGKWTVVTVKATDLLISISQYTLESSRHVMHLTFICNPYSLSTLQKA